MKQVDIIEIMGLIDCGRIKWRVEPTLGGSFLQTVFRVNGQEQRGRKWYISEHACRSEVVQTAFMAVLTIMEHEIRESFLYKGRAVFGPHFNIEALHELTTESNLEVRHEETPKH